MARGRAGDPDGKQAGKKIAAVPSPLFDLDESELLARPDGVGARWLP